MHFMDTYSEDIKFSSPLVRKASFCFPEHICSTLPVMSTALSPTGSSALPPRYTEETRHTAQNTTSPPPAPSVATLSSPSKAGRSLHTSTFALSARILLSMQSMVTPKSTVMPRQSHPGGLLVRASISRGEKQAHTHTPPPAGLKQVLLNAAHVI